MKDLQENENLRKRLDPMFKGFTKSSLPGANPYEKPQPPLEEYLRQVEESEEPVLEYNLDGYGLKSLKDIKFRPEVEQISLFDNELEDPAEIQALAALPNLKGLWLNDSPIVEYCPNFNVIGESFPKLEILNSQFTSKAGEWAIMLYAKDTGATCLEEIETLDIRGKNLLFIEDWSFLKRMTNLKRLDVAENVDMFLTKKMMEEEARYEASKLGKEMIDYMPNRHTREELLDHLPNLEYLTCDNILEAQICLDRPKSEGKMLPKIKTINRVPITNTNAVDRVKQKQIKDLYDSAWKFCQTYRLTKGDKMDSDPIFYINEEVGSAINHRDAPNVELRPFLHEKHFMNPQNSNMMSYSLLWLKEDIPAQEYLYRDFLLGVDES